MAGLELRDISFAYSADLPRVIDRLSLRIAAGEAHAVLGASGAGKTTLLNMMSGLLTPQDGQIFLGDDDVTPLDGAQRRVAQVFQFPVLYNTLSVADNLALVLQRRRFGRRQSSEEQQRIQTIAEQLQLHQFMHVKAGRLSLYQRQLVALGKALVRTDTRLVLLDEPLTAVDPAQKWHLRDVLRNAQREFQLTMVYVTHDQTEALTFADRVSVLTPKGIEQTDTPENIYNTPASTYVAHFVGSPGMNLLPAELVHAAKDHVTDTVGFRPEWVQLTSAQSAGAIAAQVESVSTQGTQNGKAQGLIKLRLNADLSCWAMNDVSGLNQGDQIFFTLPRYVAFAKGQRL